jgi:hypothetical protein
LVVTDATVAAETCGVVTAMNARGITSEAPAIIPRRWRKDPREDRAEAVMTNPFASSVQAREASPDGQPETPATG